MERRRDKNISLIIVLILSLWLPACATIYNPATERKELIFIDTASEVALGNNVAAHIERQYQASEDPSLNKRVEQIGERIARYSDRTDLPYRFKVVRNKEINAFSTAGGHVYIHSGLLNITNDDELACVIAHEVGHIAARHSVKKLQAGIGYNILMSLAFGKGRFQDLEKLVNVTFNLITQGYSREDEFLADRLGIKYAFKAGYDPQGMVSFLNKLKEMEGREPLAIEILLRSHPPISQRIKNAHNEIVLLKGEKVPIPSSDKSQPALASEVKVKKPANNLPQINKIGRGGSCPTCGRTYRAYYNFCPQDGSKLINQ